MRIHHLSLLTPDLPRVLEVPHQFFLFGIHADGGMAGCLMCRSLGLQVLKLRVSLGMLLPAACLRLARKL
jgi:hypothetical protein